METHFHCSKVLIDPNIRKVADKPNEIVYPYQRVRIITVNGQIWERCFSPFGLSESFVRAEWDKRLLSEWTRIHPNELRTAQ